MASICNANPGSSCLPCQATRLMIDMSRRVRDRHNMRSPSLVAALRELSETHLLYLFTGEPTTCLYLVKL
eukprot:scaffold50773_cov65-Phaeocystis_antarctica.AAC.5